MSREPEALEIEYEITPEDYVAFNVYHRARSWRPLLGLGLLATSLYAILIVWIYSSVVEDVQLPLDARYFTVFASVGLAVLLTVLYIFRRLVFAFTAPLVLRRNPNFLGPKRIVLTPDGVAAEHESGNFFLRWRGVHKVAATKDHVFLYATANTALLVPRRAFPEDRDFTEFVETARRWYEQGKTRTIPVPGDADGRWQGRKPTGIQAPPERDAAGGGEGIAPK